MDELVSAIESKREFGELVCQRLIACIEKAGFTSGLIASYPKYQEARFELLQDPFTGKFNLCGFWYDSHNQRMGRLQFQSDDSCYAEYTVGKQHPGKPLWFIDNAIAWGKPDSLKTELALLRFPD